MMVILVSYHMTIFFLFTFLLDYYIYVCRKSVTKNYILFEKIVWASMSSLCFGREKYKKSISVEVEL